MSQDQITIVDTSPDRVFHHHNLCPTIHLSKSEIAAGGGSGGAAAGGGGGSGGGGGQRQGGAAAGGGGQRRGGRGEADQGLSWRECKL